MMNDDRLGQLESELRAFRPPPPSDGAVGRVEQGLRRGRLSLGDRVLAMTLSAASVAACLILGLLVTGRSPGPVSEPVQAAVPRDVPTLANPEPLFARADVRN